MIPEIRNKIIYGCVMDVRIKDDRYKTGVILSLALKES